MKWNLEEEVKTLHEQGWTNQKIANHLSEKYPDIDELRDISHMSINRFLSTEHQSDIEKKLEIVKDPVKFIHEEFNAKIRDNLQDAQQMNNIVNEISLKLQDKDNISLSELNRLINAWKKTNEQVRVNLVALRQYSEGGMIKPIQNIIFKKELNIRNLVLDVSRDLCPMCRKKVEKHLEEYAKV